MKKQNRITDSAKYLNTNLKKIKDKKMLKNKSVGLHLQVISLPKAIFCFCLMKSTEIKYVQSRMSTKLQLRSGKAVLIRTTGKVLTSCLI